mmetsp:Transcript_6524/g.7403  ORF Transcript_6524/g.7403 Transcript_6524/m.7403 type:complete len:211 (-) Transcript_6524:223-855(-)
MSILMLFVVLALAAIYLSNDSITASAFHHHRPLVSSTTGSPITTPIITRYKNNNASPLTSRSLSYFFIHKNRQSSSSTSSSSSSSLYMAQISQQEAEKAIATVVRVLQKDSDAKKELGKLNKVENILGFGSPQKGKIAVRFNASFKKGGGLSNPFTSSSSSSSDNKDSGSGSRGTMVGQVKASVDQTSGKVIECSVFRDLGYGRAFNLQI